MKVVLHICCGVCAGGVVERLTADGHEVAGLFYNPNIHPAEEYRRRLEAAGTVAERMGFTLNEIPYIPERWFMETRSFEHEPEGGKRCEICYRIRLRETYQYMLGCDADVFTTTLTISPHKLAKTINRIGSEVGGDRFMAMDFKKRDGFKRTVQLARESEIYRQEYCGCLYSQS